MWFTSSITLYLLVSISIDLTESSHIEIIKEENLVFNKQKINESNLHHYLENHEKLLLFGKDMQNSKYKLINVKHHQRTKRSAVSESTINIKISDSNDDNLQLHLQRSQNLIDKYNFALISRYDNYSKFVDNSFDLAQKYGNCFYRSENSAFDLCDHEIRGIYRRNDTDVFIQPLPERFGIGSHILVEKEIERSIFEPQENFHEPDIHKELAKSRVRVKRNTLIKAPQSKFFLTTHSKMVPEVLHIETAIFVDKDLFRHMVKNFPKNTEQNLIRFILAMINGVQLLYHHPSLGRQINFILKRIEILHNEISDLRRSSDIDVYLNSFCFWQRNLNPVSDSDVVHFDHAVILTGLDLYVVSKNGKVSSQVVGLAPVSGMCTTTSSCTINEGKHFESVFVVAHEIGHNLGMRHDSSESNCDPSLYIMSPTLGSGKITWSSCSKSYLETFLKTTQAKCLFDRGTFGNNLDHAAEGILPGERFDADQQCMLKYGRDSVRARSQNLGDICKDLHCQRDRYTWTSHPALEGTYCGYEMWCRSGVCSSKNALIEMKYDQKQLFPLKSLEKSSIIEEKRFSSLIQEPTLLYTNGINGVSNKVSLWSNWGKLSECESGCLYGENGRLREGSTGLKVSSRTCLDYRISKKKCVGSDKKYETCTAKQCYSVPKLTILEFANQICRRAGEFDKDIIGDGVQQVGTDPEDSCKVFCKTKTGLKSKSWTFPDGTSCRNQNSDIDDTFYCISGKCEKFTCKNSTENFFKIDPVFCPESLVSENEKQLNNVLQENGRDYKSIDLKNNSKVILHDSVVNENNETSFFNLLPERLVSATSTEVQSTTAITTTTQKTTTLAYFPSKFPKFFTKSNNSSNSYSIRRHYPSAATHSSPWRHLRKYHHDMQPSSQHQVNDYFPLSLRNKWASKSGCHYSCIENAKGLQMVTSKVDIVNSIQLCSASTAPCEKVLTTTEFSTNLCKKYQSKVRGLSGIGMQIAPSVEDPDRSCRVACQDQFLNHRFYLVNGEHGLFPFGTRCASKNSNEKRFCVNGKCLKFGSDDTPINGMYNTFSAVRSKRDLRSKRHFENFSPINITEMINSEYLNNLITNLDFRDRSEKEKHQIILEEHIDLNNPVYIYSNQDYE